MTGILKSAQELGDVIPNLAVILKQNAGRYGDKVVYQENKGTGFESVSWTQFYQDIRTIAFNLGKFGFSRGEKVAIFSRNRQEMLEIQLAVMASGGVAVPIFANYPKERAESLIKHSRANLLALSGQSQLDKIDTELSLSHIFYFDENVDTSGFENITHFPELLREKAEADYDLAFDLAPDTVCLEMFTSGTMSTPKAVRLMHKNILSQQAALKILWDINENDRFLSYLPWHHSFGGIFELYMALYHGAPLSLEPSYGKSPESIMENWKVIKPTVFFSVPKVYQALMTLISDNPELEDVFFHPELKFVFTAAAPLPSNISNIFEARNIPVVEGWGLTETSPCCTLTDPSLKRKPGVVGKPIPGVGLKLSDINEVLVKGPNVMAGYFDNDEANADAFTDDGWFCTGDIGEFTEAGLKLVGRKDRMFKLSNAEKVIPPEIESLILGKCCYLNYAVIVGNGEEHPTALLYPNKALFETQADDAYAGNECVHPSNLENFSHCLEGCLNQINQQINTKFARLERVMIVDKELSIEQNELTPSMKLAVNTVIKHYTAHIENLYGADNEIDEDVYIVKLKR